MTPRLQKSDIPHLLLILGLAIAPVIFTGCDRTTRTSDSLTTPDSMVTFGKVVTAANVDSNNAPTALADTFSPSQKTIYVVAEAKQIAPGTRIAASWTRDGTPVEVSKEIIASKGYHDTNIEFHLNSGPEGFTPGRYKVELIVNGTAGPTAHYTVK